MTSFLMSSWVNGQKPLTSAHELQPCASLVGSTCKALADPFDKLACMFCSQRCGLTHIIPGDTSETKSDHTLTCGSLRLKQTHRVSHSTRDQVSGSHRHPSVQVHG